MNRTPGLPSGCDLYRFYDANDVLLYVGISLNAAHRANTHRKDKPWWTDVARMDVQHLPTRSVALDAERAAIAAEKPLHNIIHNGRWTTPVPYLNERREELRQGRIAIGELRKGDIVIHVESGVPGSVIKTYIQMGSVSVHLFDGRFIHALGQRFNSTGIHAANNRLTDADKHAICDELGIAA